MKFRWFKVLLGCLFLLLVLDQISQSEGNSDVSALVPASNAYDLIDAVNGLRASHGLPPYTPNSILMQIAQSQASYIASTGGASGHIGPGGTHPIDRALAAGYPVSGGYISENWESGMGLDAQGAVNNWMGDAPHQGTMLSSTLHDIGAGVAQDGNLYYYVIDCALLRKRPSLARNHAVGSSRRRWSVLPDIQQQVLTQDYQERWRCFARRHRPYWCWT